MRRPELDKTKNHVAILAFIAGLGYKDTAESWGPFSFEDEDYYDPYGYSCPDDFEDIGLDDYPELKQRGTAFWYSMSYRRWNRIYYQASDRASTGVVMLLVAKVPGRGREWAAVDPTGRVQMINPQDKTRVATRPLRNVDYTNHPGLSLPLQEEAIMSAERPIARSQHANVKDGGARKKPARDKPNKRNNTVWWAIEWLGNASVYTWARRNYGVGLSATFLWWRVWQYFGFSSWISWTRERIYGTMEAAEWVGDARESIVEMQNSGELDLYIIVVGVATLIVYGIYKYSDAPANDSDTESEGGFEAGTDVSDSDDEPNSNEPYKCLIAEQNTLAEEIRKVANKPVQVGAAAAGAHPKSQAGIASNGTSPRGSTGSSQGPVVGASDSDGAEPSTAQIDDLLRKLEEHTNIVKADSHAFTTGATAGSSVRREEPIAITGDGPPGLVRLKIEETEQEAKNPRESMLAALRRYKDMKSFGQVGEIKSRTAPHMLPRLYRSGHAAKHGMQGWLKSKELETCPAACEVFVLAMVRDRMLETGEVADFINSRSAELVCLRIYVQHHEGLRAGHPKG